MSNLLFAGNMRFLRSRNNLKQADMLLELGYKQSTWNGYERGASSPNLDDLIRISDFFGILESDLLRTQITDSAINDLHDNYIRKQNAPLKIKDTPRSEAFLSYYKASGKRSAPAGPEEKKGKGLRYTNEMPGLPAREAVSDAARIDRLEEMVHAIKNILERYDP